MNISPTSALPDAAWGASMAGAAAPAEEAGLVPGLPPGGGLEGGGTARNALAMPGAVLGVLAAGLDAATLNGQTQGHAETAPWGSPSDELTAGGQYALLSDLARQSARSPGQAHPQAGDAASPALRTGEASGRADGVRADAALADATTVARSVAAEVSSPLAPALFTALQAGATLLRRPTWQDERRRDGQAPTQEAEDTAEDDAAGSKEGRLPSAPQADERPARAPQAELAAPTPPWAHAVLTALRREAHRPAAQAALRRAMEAWQCGRAVLLACPQHRQDATQGWLFVLWPGADPQRPSLQGQRFEARLSWAAAGEAGRWWAVRVAKVHSVRQGRQLSTLAAWGDGALAAAGGDVPCEIQLGPFPVALPRWREVLIRVDAAQRVWAALDVLWSLPLLVCDRPLALPPDGLAQEVGA